MSNKVQYSEYCVAYLDILGFRNIVASEDASSIHRIFSSIRLAKRLTSSKTDHTCFSTRLQEKTKYYFFSDSIVCAVPMDESSALEWITSNCMLLQHLLWAKENPAWIRGGIAIGKLYCGQGEVFGPALVDAFMLESTLAKYPRIIMTDKTYRYGVDHSEDTDIPYVFPTSDGFRMVECFRYFDYEPSRTNLIDLTERILYETVNPGIREKHLWIKNTYATLFDQQNK